MCDRGGGIGNQPYVFYLWQRVQDAYAALDPGGRAAVHATPAAHGLAPLVDTELPTPARRADHQEVWGDLAPLGT